MEVTCRSVLVPNNHELRALGSSQGPCFLGKATACSTLVVTGTLLSSPTSALGRIIRTIGLSYPETNIISKLFYFLANCGTSPNTITLTASPCEIILVQHTTTHIKPCSILAAYHNGVSIVFRSLLTISKQIRSSFCGFNSHIHWALPRLVFTAVCSNQALCLALTSYLNYQHLLETTLNVQLLFFVFSGARKWRYHYNSWRRKSPEDFVTMVSNVNADRADQTQRLQDAQQRR